MKETPMYELEDVTRIYGAGGAEVRAVDGVTLSIPAGELCVIAGPSGSGKTTLLQLLGGLDRATSGRVLLEDRDLGSLGDGELTVVRLRTIGFIFQQFNLIPTLTAGQNVEAAIAPTGMRGAQRHERTDELLASVGLAKRRDHLPGMLSGGEQQRVAIARALANEPRVLLADEPTGNLDTRTGEDIVDLLVDLVEDRGLTVVLITHDPTIADRAPRVVRMADGQISPELAPQRVSALRASRPAAAG
jgi:putative ABC transport system ATP-binding protein